MRKLIIVLLLIGIVLSLIVSKVKEQSSELTSEEMRDEIIRQLKEKEGMTIREYILEQYYRRMMEE